MSIYGPNLFKKHMYIWPEPNPLLHNKYMYMYDTSTGSATVVVPVPVPVHAWAKVHVLYNTNCEVRARL